MVQNWGGRVLTFFLSLILARLLSPEEYGIASAAALFLTIVPLIAEFGFSDAILQRRDLRHSDLNVPFYASIFTVTLLVIVISIMSDFIERRVGIRGFAPYLVAIAATIVINTPSMFQEAMFKRNMMFKSLALRTFVSNIIGGIAAVISAMAGLGVWSFVIQAYVGTIINIVWLWARPQWLPSLSLNFATFVPLSRFGLPILAQRLLEFGGSRFIDIIIIHHLGIAAYGIYTVGARLYQTLMQLLQGALYDVSVRVLSTISDDKARISEVYIKTIRLASYAISPIFVLFAAVSFELCRFLFGPKWAGMEHVAQPLLLLGAVQCVQYMNGSFVLAKGRPEITLIAGSVKTIAPILGLLLFPSTDLRVLTITFVVGQLVSTPVSFWFASREIGIPIFRILRTLFPAVAANICALSAATLVQPHLYKFDMTIFWRGSSIGIVFVLVYIFALFLLDRRAIRLAFLHIATITKSLRSKPAPE